MVKMNSNEDALSLVPCGFLISLNCSDHFSVNPAITPVRATGHQLVTLRRSICARERAQILDPLMGSMYFTPYFITFVAFPSSLYFPVHRIRCRSSTSGPNVSDTSDTSADESEASHPRRRVRSKRTYQIKKVWGQMKWVSSSSLELQMQLATQAISIVASAAKTFWC